MKRCCEAPFIYLEINKALPPEVIDHILSPAFLPFKDLVTASQVCGFWKNRKLEILNNIRSNISDQIGKPFPIDFQKLFFPSEDKQLYFSSLLSPYINPVIDTWINKNEISLTALGCKRTVEAVKYIIEYQLTDANLSGYTFFDDTDLESLSENCPQLKKLSFPATQITSDKLALSVGKFSNLVSLNINGGIQISEDHLAKAIGKLTILQNLTLRSCGQIYGDKISYAIDQLVHLRSLDLGWSLKINSTRMIESIGKITTLQNLNLSGLRTLTNSIFIPSIGNLTQLESLDLSDCRNLHQIDISQLIGKLPKLRNLNLSGTTISAREILGAIETPLLLESLNLGNCYQITGDELAELLKKLPRLKILILKGCKLSGDQFAKALGKLIHLHTLDLGHCQELPGSPFAIALAKLTDLISLTLSGCNTIPIAELVNSIIKLNRLQILNLSWCDQMTDILIANVIAKLPGLISLNLSGCKKLAGYGLPEVLKQHPKLHCLDITMCTNISYDKIFIIFEIVPKLKS